MGALRQKFRQFDGPTWIVAMVLYSLWFLLIWFNAAPPLVGHHAGRGVSAGLAFLVAA